MVGIMRKANIGLAGLAVMGQNLALNLEGKGFTTAVFNRTSSKTDDFMRTRAVGKNFEAAHSLEDFVSLLERPRKIILMVKAGSAVDEIIDNLLPFLERDDIILDGGNSHFRDTESRQKKLIEKGVHLLGVGISGGEEGALHGPCIMPGGSRDAYEHVREILEKISAKVNNIPCCNYMGPDGAGHFVKMVHNGIEYGLMQLIAECYDYSRQGLDFKPDVIAELFEKWNNRDTGSYLLEISIDILRTKDPDTGNPIVDVILDKAQHKGTGKWVSETALELGVPTPVNRCGSFIKTSLDTQGRKDQSFSPTVRSGKILQRYECDDN
jgi:6-phosphogluconate dehydrogenase